MVYFSSGKILSTHIHTCTHTELGAVSVGVKGFDKARAQLTSFSPPKSLQTVTVATKLKDACFLEGKL